MSDKITTWAKKWRDLIFIGGFLLTCISLVAADNGRWGRQEEFDRNLRTEQEVQDKKIVRLEVAKDSQLVYNATFIQGLNKLNSDLNDSRTDRAKIWAEIIRLDKEHKFLPVDWEKKIK